ncbi:hypothetical protein NAP1_10383 [Erythrobacter sp. NAP1]|uniref:VOC family protein n=1 Tax=Erythrobacter sp. NAP1 TaxID=237727 RepID=UPI0000687845|nr:VOC family protein [Erythrobacter sp. NAP1]EAQ27994.1 hypothetical protein NAP1_10383 [Erythrobacter sp. NAP1]
MTTLSLATVTLVVPQYDAGIAFYCGRLGFELAQDTDLGHGKRWVVVTPSRGARLLLAKASGDDQLAAIGNQAGGRVAFFLETDNFTKTYEHFSRAEVNFLEQPREEPYGKVVVFSDPFGNRWDLIEPKDT